MSLRTTGGIAALTAAVTFVIGLVMFATMLMDYTTSESADASVAFLVDNHAALFVWNLIITIVFGVALVPLSYALGDRLASARGSAVKVSTAFGLMWATVIIATGMIANVGYKAVIDLHATDPEGAVTLWRALDTVQDGLGGGNELIGGVWILLVTLTAMRTRAIPRWVNHFGLGAAAAGLITIVPGLSDLGAIFGIGSIVWFVGVGIALLRGEPTPREGATVSATAAATAQA